MTNKLAADIPNFRMNYFLSMILYESYEYCLGLGWENEEVYIEVTSETTLRDCYKELIISLCDRSAAWTGQDAKYFDECDTSQSVLAQVYTTTWKESNID